MNYDLTLFEQQQEAERQTQLAAYKRMMEYYTGKQRQSLPVKTGQPDDNVVINLSRLIVDKSASFLFGKSIEFQLQEGKTTADEEWLELVWARNGKKTFLQKLGKSGGIFGHNFIKIIPDGIAPDIPRLILLEPENVSVVTDPEDIDQVVQYVIEWKAIDPADGKGKYYRQTIAKDDAGKWQIENRIAKGGDIWQPDPNAPDFTWEYDWPPVVDSPNLLLPGAHHGIGDIEDERMQDAVNYIASLLTRIVRYHAAPKTVGKGFAAKDMKLAEDGVTVLPTVDSDLWNLEMQGDMVGEMGLLDRLISWGLAVARIPRIDPAQVSVGALSGFALKVLYGDLLELTEDKRCTYGDLLREVNRRMLNLHTKRSDYYATLIWPDPLPVDEQAQTVSLQFDLNNKLASRETAQTKRGYDPEAENERIAKDTMVGENLGERLLKNFETQFGGGMQ